MSEFAELRERFASRSTGDSFTMRCPSHDDRTASLSVRAKRDGSALVHCFAGCDWKDIRDRLGASKPQRDASARAVSPAKALTAQYSYRDSSGGVVAVKRRYEPKTFDWVSADATGTLRPGLGSAGQSALPLYRLPDVLSGVASGSRVYVVEGEKDADNLAALGLIATTNPEGAGPAKWPDGRWSALAGADVVIVPDNDDIGRKHGARIAAAVAASAASVRVLDLPSLPPKGDVSDWLKSGGTAEQLDTLAESEPIWAGESDSVPPMSDLLEQLAVTLRRFVVLPEEATVAAALWIVHTHAFEVAEFSPYLHVTSPTRESGKTTLLDVLEALAANPLRADSATPAAIYRAVDVGRGRGEAKGPPPSLLLDELDTVYGSGAGARSEKGEALRNLLNSGFRRGGQALICDGDNHDTRAFVVFSPKVLAGIGASSVPDTVASRSIPLPLSRATRPELAKLERARATALRSLEPLREQVAERARLVMPSLAARVEPDILGVSARQADIWGPLLNIAAEAGGDWLDRARAAALTLHAEKGDATDGRDPGIALLSDLRDIFDEEAGRFLSSAHLAEKLKKMDGRPWPEYSRGGPITTHAVSRLLRPFGILPKPGRTVSDYQQVRGYYAEDCAEPFRRYLPSRERGEPLADASPDTCDTLTISDALTGGTSTLSFLPDPEGAEPVPF